MKVRCLKDVYEGRALIGGKVYDVISVERGWYRIVCEIEEDYLFPPELFEVVENDDLE